MGVLALASLGSLLLNGRGNVNTATPLALSPASVIKRGHGLRVLDNFIQLFKRKQTLEVWLLWKESRGVNGSWAPVMLGAQCWVR